MALTCTKLGANSTISCASPPVAGLDNFIYLINKSDISAFTTIGSGDDTINSITLSTTTGTRAYKWEGSNDFVNGNGDVFAQGLISGFTHSLTFTLPDDTQASLTELKNLANGRVVAIVAKNDFDTNGTFRVYGINAGLVLTSAVFDENNGEQDGLPILTLSTPENKKEPLPPRHYLVTDYATTLAALEAMQTPAP